MHTIETTAVVTANHELVLQGPVPKEIPPGEHAVVITIDPQPSEQEPVGPLFRPPYSIGVTDDTLTFSREEIYEDADR